MNLINTCRNISLHSEEILFNWQQEILYRFAIDWRCPFLDAIASPSTYPCQSVSEWVSQWVIVSDLEIAIASPSFASLLLQIRYNMDIYFIVGLAQITSILPLPLPLKLILQVIVVRPSSSSSRAPSPPSSSSSACPSGYWVYHCLANNTNK